MNKEKKCKCPHCESELTQHCFAPVFCEPCKIEFVICSKCGKPYNKEIKVCPNCK